MPALVPIRFNSDLKAACQRLLKARKAAITASPPGLRRRSAGRPSTGRPPFSASPFRTGFLRGLADRGLRDVKLVIADDHKGLRAASIRAGFRRDPPALPRSLAPERSGPCADEAAHGGDRDAEDDLRVRQTKTEAQWAVVADALREKSKLGAMMDAPATMSSPA